MMKKALSILVTFLLVLAGVTPTHADVNLPVLPRPLPTKLYGWTTDNGYSTNRLTYAANSTVKPSTVRVVFDEFVSASEYKPTVSALSRKAYVMGEILDSYYMPQYTLSEYAARTTQYLNTLSSYVDIWEVGNEINGGWLGADASAKAVNAYNQVASRGLTTELTLYYNPNCYESSANEMWRWLDNPANLTPAMRSGLNYVLISYYEQDCNGQKFSQAQWQQVFDRLKTYFPNSKVGFGEMGTRRGANIDKQREVMTRYYTMQINTSGYVGGYFWWYGYQHLTKSSYSVGELMSTFNNVIRYY
jgi:hypothetical protein